MTITEIQKEISMLESRLVYLRNQLEMEQNKEKENEAYKNSYEMFNDGIKLTNTPETAILIRIPMFYKANLYYKTVETITKDVPVVDKDGNESTDTAVEELVKVYVCMPEDGSTEGMLTVENFDSIMVPWDID